MAGTLPSIPPLNSLPARPKRIILHWTGGGHRANSVDRRHYHYVIEGDGTVVAGEHPVAANLRTPLKDGEYAAHTGGFNAGSVGVALAGMFGARRGGDAGPYPLTKAQIDTLITFVALLCDTWGLDPHDPAQLFTHHEAWTLHRVKGVSNPTKWDITTIPFRPDLEEDEVGPWLRWQIADRLRRFREMRSAA